MNKLILTALFLIPLAMASIDINYPLEQRYYEPVTSISYTFDVEPQPYPQLGQCYYSTDGGLTKSFSLCVINAGESSLTVSFDGLSSVCGTNIWAVGFINEDYSLNKRVKFNEIC